MSYGAAILYEFIGDLNIQAARESVPDAEIVVECPTVHLPPAVGIDRHRYLRTFDPNQVGKMLAGIIDVVISVIGTATP